MVIGFDLDDTLYMRKEALKRVYDFYNFNFDFKEFRKIYDIFCNEAFDLNAEKKLSLKESRIYRVKNTLLKFNINFDDEECLKFQEKYENFQNDIKFIEGFDKIFKFLNEKEITIFILTNGPLNHQLNKVKNLGLDKYVSREKIFISDEIGVAKPNIEAFEIVKNKLNISDDIYFIGDSIRNDLYGSRNAGWKPIYFKFDDEMPECNEFLTFYDTKSLFEYIKKLVNS